MASESSFLRRRFQMWQVRVKVPAAAQKALGCKALTRSLQTRDKAEANRRKHAVLAELQEQIRQAMTGESGPTPTGPEGLLTSAVRARASIEAGDTLPHHAEAALDAAVDDYRDQNPDIPEAAAATIRRAYGTLRGEPDRGLSANVAAYLSEQARHLTAQTVIDKRKRLEAFAGWAGESREAGDITRKIAGDYVSKVIQNRTQKLASGEIVALSATTRAKEVSDLRAFFQWLEARGVIDANPFYRMASSIKSSTRAKAQARRPWQPEELSRFLDGVPQSDPLWAMTAIAAYTGMRREEIATLRASSVDGDVLQVEEGKTAAARRRVPIHPAIAPLISQLSATTSDGYLLPGLLPGGPDGKRGWLIGKRFGTALKSAGLASDRLDFHAFRATVITQLEEACIPIPTIQLIVGHERQGVTLGAYSGGVSDAVKLEAIRKVTYSALDELVETGGPSVVVTMKSRPRKRTER